MTALPADLARILSIPSEELGRGSPFATRRVPDRSRASTVDPVVPVLTDVAAVPGEGEFCRAAIPHCGAAP